MAGFRVRPTADVETGLRFCESVLAKSLPDGSKPVVTDGVVGASVFRPTFVLGSAPQPARAVWNSDGARRRVESPAPRFSATIRTSNKLPEAVARISLEVKPGRDLPHASPVVFTRNSWQPRQASLPDAALPSSLAGVGMRVPQLTPQNPAAQLAAHTHVSRTVAPPVFAVSLPEAVRHGAPESADMLLPRFTAKAAVPLSALRPIASARSLTVAFPLDAVIAGPQTPPTQTTHTAAPSPAAFVSQPRRQPVAVPHPIAIETGVGKLDVAPPQAPETAHARTLAPNPYSQAAPRVPELVPAVAAAGAEPALPGLEITFRAGEQIDRVTHRPLGLAPMSLAVEPQPALPAGSPAWCAMPAVVAHGEYRVACPGTPATPGSGLLPAASPAVHEATGRQAPRPESALLPAPAVPLATPRMQSGIPEGINLAPPSSAAPPAPAAPRTAALAWNSKWGSQRHPICAPVPGEAQPKIDYFPILARLLSTPARAWHPGVGRSARGCAVLWTLRVANLSSPGFDVHPIRVKFNDLLTAGVSYGLDGLDLAPRKSSFQVIRGGRIGLPPQKRKLRFVGAAAAAVLLAALWRLPISFKGITASASGHQSVRQWLAARAVRDFADDFRGGLDQWKGGPASGPKGWSYSTDGFVHPGQMALFRPSVPLTDYRFEFMAQIENKSVDWAVRAKDPQNYYAVKFTVLQPGPRPMVAMVHYPVIDGNKGSRVLTPLRMMVHANTPYRVTMDVKGDRYRTFIEGQEADFWTDDRLKTGGIGFFSDAGERARVYWVKLESHGDFLGRICGFLSGGTSQDGTKENQAWITGTQVATKQLPAWSWPPVQ